MSWKLLSWLKFRGKKKNKATIVPSCRPTTPSLSLQLYGIDVNRSNSYDQTALDLVKQFTKSRAARELKHVLAEALASVTARAVRDHLADPKDPTSLSFSEGELITVLEKNSDGRWKGVIVGDRRSNSTTPRSGYFPASAVVVLPTTVGGMQRAGKPVQGKKVAPPTVPITAPPPTNGNSATDANITVTSAATTNVTLGHSHRHSGSSFGSGYGSASSSSDNRSSIGTDDAFPPPPSPSTHQHGDACDHSGVYASRFPGGVPTQSPENVTQYTAFPFSGAPILHPATHHLRRAGGHPPSPLYQQTSANTEYGYGVMMQQPTAAYQHQVSLEDQGIDVSQSPGRDSPGSSGSGSSSGGCRHSTTSLDSGRASGSVSEGRAGHGLYAQIPCAHRLSGQSYESNHSGSLRHSYPSSSSCSSGSLERGEESAICSLNVSDMLLTGIPDHEVLNAWLTDLHLEEYYHLFIQAGYDMPTISRMTPEDLTAIGMKKPNHRKKLKAEIAQLNITDGLPEYNPTSLEEWLHLLRLEEYLPALSAQGYHTVDQVTDLTWEDLEDIGIVKLGHQKKILLAIKRVKDIKEGKRLPGVPQHDPRFAHHYHTQEITITPSTQSQFSGHQDAYRPVPEFRTFQQQQQSVRVPRWEVGDVGAYYGGVPPHPMTQQAFYQPDVISVPAYSPRGKSLESLENGTNEPHRQSVLQQPTYGGGMMHSFYVDPRHPAVNPNYQQWPHQRSYDDGDITPTNELAMYHLQHETSTCTLPRPRGTVKPRPVAKITAKTRPAEDLFIEELHHQKPTMVECYKSLPRDPLQREKYLAEANKLYHMGTLRKPPAPPRRTNSLNEGCVTEAIEMVEVAPTPTPTPTAGEDEFPPPPPPITDESFGSDTSDSPSSGGSMSVCSVRERFEPQSSGTLPRSASKSSSNGVASVGGQQRSRDPSPAASSASNGASDVSDSELSANPLFRQRRNGSDASFKSNSSTESDSLPFANENAGTIKQRAARQHPGLMAVEGNGNVMGTPSQSPSPPRKITNESLPAIQPLSPLRMMPNVGTRRRHVRESDVLNDIGTMLADLTSELDAMLEAERKQATK